MGEYDNLLGKKVNFIKPKEMEKINRDINQKREHMNQKREHDNIIKEVRGIRYIEKPISSRFALKISRISEEAKEEIVKTRSDIVRDIENKDSLVGKFSDYCRNQHNREEKGDATDDIFSLRKRKGR